MNEMEWHPIDTAPNGLLLFFDQNARELRHAWFVGWRHAGSDQGCATTNESAQRPATHWMPLPCDPKPNREHAR
jgi:hypothetical protein